MNELRAAAQHCLLISNVDDKLSAVRQLNSLWLSEDIALDRLWSAPAVESPGRPERPEMIKASRVPRRGFGTTQGRAIMMHAIAHIEFNAINLALDAVQRFAGMPEEFYSDWLRVAHEEAYHFELIRAHMRHLGADYGDFVAHGGLWEMCEKTAYDVLARMALVPRVLEARGLDVTPGIQEKLIQAGDENAATILDVILRDEIGHVAIGNRWYRHLCRERGLEPVPYFLQLLEKHYPKGLFGPFNIDARERAGFSESELAMLIGEQ
ncbi:Uncharacterized conserved protein, contains ferritin-like DUF455 domain [Mariprofundus ferrinatatus]|uniref:Uncharacterized conserved protein, contains ferritin-like DUF455 domain n=1 Tax=Mariprofundus ferrinatatus TaxID=1921087 RepID=A0A2K8L267_9PROT|nr:ferritin-like domain-containing protein [Mariprofundus ferrinatatus]ATX81343.1 Uncharacterized conserved protein, contains ferritin-like DUF455 domain [Mariprofundus ferrinatatus]